MREKLQTLPLSELKEMAKGRGIKGISTLRKAEIIDLLCKEAEREPKEEQLPQKQEASPLTRQERGKSRRREPSRGAGKENGARRQEAARGQAEEDSQENARVNERSQEGQGDDGADSRNRNRNFSESADFLYYRRSGNQ